MSVMAKFLRSFRPAPAVRPARRFRPSLEALEGRVVPAAIDLTTAGSAGAANGAIFSQASPQPTGSGVIHSFVRLQAHQGAAVEQGYNTDARPLQFDEKSSPVFTRSLQAGDVPTVTIDGVAYKEFLLDINQSHAGNNSLLSLDELRVYTADKPNLKGYDAKTNQLDGHAAVYDLDAGGDNSVLLDAGLSHGSGSGDMFFYVPASLFTATGGSYVYLYSKFGGVAASNGGFEEWAVRSSSTAAAPPLSSLSGTVYLDNNTDGTLDSGDSGLGSMTVTLTGTNDLGQAVSLTTITKPDGSYAFVGLRAGTYTLSETGFDSYFNGTDTAGNLGGNVSTDTISTIKLPSGVAGFGYDFGELLTPSGTGSTSSTSGTSPNA